MLSNKIKVTVAGQIFEVPAEKQGELLRLLAAWQAISVSENQNNSQRYDGLRLING